MAPYMSRILLVGGIWVELTGNAKGMYPLDVKGCILAPVINKVWSLDWWENAWGMTCIIFGSANIEMHWGGLTSEPKQMSVRYFWGCLFQINHDDLANVKCFQSSVRSKCPDSYSFSILCSRNKSKRSEFNLHRSTIIPSAARRLSTRQLRCAKSMGFYCLCHGGIKFDYHDPVWKAWMMWMCR